MRRIDQIRRLITLALNDPSFDLRANSSCCENIDPIISLASGSSMDNRKIEFLFKKDTYTCSNPNQSVVETSIGRLESVWLPNRRAIAERLR